MTLGFSEGREQEGFRFARGLVPTGLNSWPEGRKEDGVGAEEQEGPEFVGGTKGRQHCGWKKGLFAQQAPYVTLQ